jgi:predicted nuclease of predicted toxin-antitoxin system
MRFFLDHNVPASVGRTLRDGGHEVIIQSDALAADAPDPLVALTSAENDAILITFDRDYRSIASRLGASNRRLKRLSRIQFRCNEPAAAKRIALGLSFIEHEWELAQSSTDKRIFLEIQGNGFKTIR